MDGKWQAGKYVGISEEGLTSTWCHFGQWFLFPDHVPWLSLGPLYAHAILEGVGKHWGSGYL